MGFFSAIKKMFGGAEQADAIAPQDDAAAKVAAESGAEAGAEAGAAPVISFKTSSIMLFNICSFIAIFLHPFLYACWVNSPWNILDLCPSFITDYITSFYSMIGIWIVNC